MGRHGLARGLAEILGRSIPEPRCPESSTLSPRIAPVSVGWSGHCLPWWAFAAANRLVHSLSHGQALGRCNLTRRAEEATPAGTLTNLVRMIPGVAFVNLSPTIVAAARVSRWSLHMRTLPPHLHYFYHANAFQNTRISVIIQVHGKEVGRGRPMPLGLHELWKERRMRYSGCKGRVIENSEDSSSCTPFRCAPVIGRQ